MLMFMYQEPSCRFSAVKRPAGQLRSAYGIDQIRFAGPGGTTVTGDGTGQTIAIVEEGVDPTLGADLTTFDSYFGIPAPPSFQVVDQNGSTTQNVDIVGEASLDVEWAHAVAPGASIIVYNAEYEPSDPTASSENLLTAMQQASEIPGVSVVTLSYGEPESALAAGSEQSLDADFTTQGVTFLAASGDSGIYGDGGRVVAANYPAASPNIVSVGGTSIVIDAAGDYPGTGSSGEVAWGNGTKSGSAGGGGGGLSAVEPEPAWQTGVVPASMDPDGAARDAGRLDGFRGRPGIRRVHKHAERLVRFGVGGRVARRRRHERRRSHLGGVGRHCGPRPCARRRHATHRRHPDAARLVLAACRGFPRHRPGQ